MTSVAGRLPRFGKATMLAVLRIYRIAISPALGPACRFEPTCSAYAEQAVERFGPLQGSYLTLRRILRCHPFTPGGLDPVPSAAATVSRARSS